MIVTSAHMRAAKATYGGYCTQGVAAWFAKYGMDLRYFLQHGYPIERIEATNDELGLRVARIAREEGEA